MTPERFAQGMTFPEYLAQMRTNQERFATRLAETEIDPDDRAAMRGRKLKILVITEDWCGDALVGFPGLAKLVEGAPDVLPSAAVLTWLTMPARCVASVTYPGGPAKRGSTCRQRP